MKVAKCLIGEIRNVLRVAAGIEAVQRVGKQRLLALFRKHGVGRGIDARHFIIDHALVRPRAVGGFSLHMPALLPKDIFGDARVEHGINIYIYKIVKIAQVAAGDGVAGFVGKGKGVEKGVQRTLEQLNKGLLDGVLV